MPFDAKIVVVPVDFSGESSAAIAAGLETVQDASQLHLIHVLIPLEALSPGISLGDFSDDERTEQATQRLSELAVENGAASAERAVLFGTPGLEISEYAARQNAELIVIPSHGFHGMKRFVLGSVTERVIRHAECSVLVLRRSDAE